jgi:hypothetical protein
MTPALILPVDCAGLKRILDETIGAAVQTAAVRNGLACQANVLVQIIVTLGLDSDDLG